MSESSMSSGFQRLARVALEVARDAGWAAEIAAGSSVKERLLELADARRRVGVALSPGLTLDAAPASVAGGRAPSFEQRLRATLAAEGEVRELLAGLRDAPAGERETEALRSLDGDLARSIAWIEQSLAGRVWETWTSDGRFARDSLL